MKQFVFVALIVVSLLGALVLPAASQTPDSGSLDVFVSPQVVLSLNLRETEVSYGTLPLSASNSDRSVAVSTTLQVTNTGNATVDLMIGGSNATSGTGGADWVLNCSPSDLGTVGPNQFVHRFFVPPASVTSAEAMCPDQDKVLASSVASNTSVDYRLQFSMPTTTADFSQRTSSVTITAVQPAP